MFCAPTGTSLQAGAGIVADSVPDDEDLECRNKAAALLAAIPAARRMTAARGRGRHAGVVAGPTRRPRRLEGASLDGSGRIAPGIGRDRAPMRSAPRSESRIGSGAAAGSRRRSGRPLRAR